jgi:cellobiose phosphorylase
VVGSLADAKRAEDPEIGLMYVHSHLRYAEAMSDLGDAEALWGALLVANSIGVMEELPNASLRQRNAYFSSSDAAFRDRYQASAECAASSRATSPRTGDGGSMPAGRASARIFSSNTSSGSAGVSAKDSLSPVCRPRSATVRPPKR